MSRPDARAGSGAGSDELAVRVRRVEPGDAQRLRTLRLAALTDAPGSFWQTVAGERARPFADWQARAGRHAAGDAHTTLLLERSGWPERSGELVGMTDVHQPSLAPEFRELAAMWVAPDARGSGAADALLDAAVGWSRSVGAIGVRLWVVPGNAAAVRLYQRHGFVPIGEPEADYDDPLGKVYIPMLLALDHEEAASPTFLERARAAWTDDSA